MVQERRPRSPGAQATSGRARHRVWGRWAEAACLRSDFKARKPARREAGGEEQAGDRPPHAPQAPQAPPERPLGHGAHPKGTKRPSWRPGAAPPASAGSTGLGSSARATLRDQVLNLKNLYRYGRGSGRARRAETRGAHPPRGAAQRGCAPARC